MSHIELELADRLKEGLAFDITYCTTDLNNSNLCFLYTVIAVETAF